MTLHYKLLDKVVELSKEHIHVFLLNLNNYDDITLYDYLSEDEKERADKLKVKQKRKQFIVSRSVLRKLISNCIDKNYDEIKFYYAEHDKPFIKEKHNNKTIKFNISHSEDYILIALTLENRVGIDIEKINKKIDAESLSKRFFSQNEYEYLKSIEINKKLDAFYTIWTKKEAFIKATGKGVAFGLDKFSVTSDKQIISKIDIGNEINSIEEWFCFELMPVDEYKTALVTDVKDVELIFYQ